MISLSLLHFLSYKYILQWITLKQDIPSCIFSDINVDYLVVEIRSGNAVIQLRFITSRNSSVGRALDWRSKGPWFDPGFRQPPNLVAGNFFCWKVVNSKIRGFGNSVRKFWDVHNILFWPHHSLLLCMQRSYYFTC